MVGGDRRSPPRHRAKGGGGKGKGSGSNEGLRGGSVGIEKSVDAKATARGMEEFKFGTSSIEESLKLGSDPTKQGFVKEMTFRFGATTPNPQVMDAVNHDRGAVNHDRGATDDNMVDLQEIKASESTVGSHVKSWAAAMDEEEEEDRAQVNATDVSKLDSDSTCTTIIRADELMCHAQSPIKSHIMTTPSSSAAMDSHTAGMECDGLFPTSVGISQCAVQGSIECVNRNVDGWMFEKLGKIGCADSSDLHSTHNCTQGVCPVASTELEAANAYVNCGLMDKGNSVLYSSSSMAAVNSLEPIEGPFNSMHGVCSSTSIGQCAANVCVNSGFMKDGKSAAGNISSRVSVMAGKSNTVELNPINHSGLCNPPCEFSQQIFNETTRNSHDKSFFFGGSAVPKSATQKSNAWRKPEHMQVDERDLQHISDDGRSLAFDVNAYETNKGKLEKGLVGKIIGRKLPLHILDQELSRRWSFVGGFRTILLSGDYFLCIFESMEARDEILLGGPWQILGHIIGLDKWSPNFNSDSLNGLSSPIWVRLPKLPLLFWDKKTISRIGAMIGKPLWIDAQTTTWGRCEYARLCVRMELSKRLPTGVWIQEHSSRFFQPIEYEGVSLLCFHCGIVGHKAEKCPNARTHETNCVNGTVHSTVGNMVGDGASKNLKTAKPSGSEFTKEAGASHTEKPSMATTSGLTTQLDTLEGEKDYGPWILVTRKRKPVRKSGKFQPSNFRTPPIVSNGGVPSSLEACDKEGMVVDSVVEDHVVRAQDDSNAIVTFQTTVGSPSHHVTTTIVENLEANTSRQPRNRSGKERVSKAHFEKELLQLGPIALKSRKRKKKVPIDGADLCLEGYAQASDSGGGDASPSRGK